MKRDILDVLSKYPLTCDMGKTVDSPTIGMLKLRQGETRATFALTADNCEVIGNNLIALAERIRARRKETAED